MYYVNERWLGGLLTNFTTIQRSIARLRDLEAMATDGRYEFMPKKEIARAEKEKRKLQKNLDGIRNMAPLPDALFVVDTRKEKIAVDEARKLKIPVIGIVDTNCDPDEVDFVIPGNDDALRSIRLFAARVADVVLDGQGERESAMADQAAAEAEAAAADEASRTVRPGRPPAPAAPSETPRSSGVSTTALPLSTVRPQGRLPGLTADPTATPARREPGRRALPRVRVQTRSIEMAITAEQVKQLRDKTGAGHDGLQGGADRSRRRHGQGDRYPAQEGPGLGRQARRPRHQGRHHRPLHPHGRQGRRARRGQLRDRLRRAHRRLPDARQGDRDARRRGRPALRQPRAHPGRGAREGKGDLPRRSSPARASRPTSSTRSSRASWRATTRRSACSTSRRCAIPTSRSSRCCHGHRQDRREHHRLALRPLQARRARRSSRRIVPARAACRSTRPARG